MPQYNNVYISQQDFEICLHHGMRYDGFVEGFGYAYTSNFTISPVHFQKYNPPGRVHDDQSFFQNGFIQYLDTSPEMRLMSVKYSHKVKSGDTLTSIAQQYGVSIQSIKDANSGINWTGERKGDRILAGEELKLPKEGNDFSGRGYQDGGGDNNQSKTSTENNTNNEISQEQKLRNLADYIRNSIYEVLPGTGVGPGNILNPFYKAEAIYGDIGSIYIAAEFDFGGFFILTGKDKGTFKKYFELGGGAAAELSAGVAYGRIDYTGNTNNFAAEMLYGDRKKGFVSAGWFGASKGLEVAVSEVRGGHTISTGISTSYGLSFPITGGYNEGEIAPKFKW